MSRIGTVLAVSLALALTGCVAAPDPEPSSTPTEAAPSATPTPTPTPTEPEFEAMDPSLFFVDQLTDAMWGSWSTQDVNFAAPGGGIGCAILGEPHQFLWGCAIDDSKTYDAQVPCGWGIEASGGELPHPRYRGDPGFPGAFASSSSDQPIRVLEVGQSVTFGDVTCYSEERGIRCENAASGHGFVISREINEIY
jgi:hypothetical protein